MAQLTPRPDGDNVTWVITSVDPRKFDLLLSWLDLIDEDIPLKEILVVCPDVNIIRLGLLEVARRHRRRVHVRTEVTEALAMVNIAAPLPLRTYFYDLLGVKLMLPLTVPTPFMFTDDDFIARYDPSYLWGETPWGSASGLDGYTETDKDIEALSALNFAMGTTETIEEFNTERTDAGAWYFPDLDRDHYRACLVRYFDHPHVHRVSVDPGVANGHTQRFRKLDQRFLSAYITSIGGFSLRSPHYRITANKKHPVKVPDATLIHYCASGGKETYMAWLWDEYNARKEARELQHPASAV